jgi:sugar phosphate isomerase/epimerase
MGYLITFENSNQKIMKKILFSLLLAFPFSLFSQCPEQVGVQLYSFRNEIPKDIPGTIAKIAAMGFKKVEFSGTYGLSLVDYKKLMDQHGLKVIAVGADFEELQNPIKRKEIMDRAKFLGSTYIITYWIGHKGNEFGISDVEKTVQVFNEAGKEFSKNGYQFLYHVHGYEFRPYKLGYLMDELIQKTDPKYVKYEILNTTEI